MVPPATPLVALPPIGVVCIGVGVGVSGGCGVCGAGESVAGDAGRGDSGG